MIQKIAQCNVSRSENGYKKKGAVTAENEIWQECRCMQASQGVSWVCVNAWCVCNDVVWQENGPVYVLHAVIESAPHNASPGV